MTEGEDGAEDGGDVVAELADELGAGGEMGLPVAAERDKDAVRLARSGDCPAAQDAVGIGVEDDLEEHGRGVGRCPGVVVAITGVEMGEVEFMVEEMIEDMLEGSGEELLGEVDGNEDRAGFEGFVARHRWNSWAGTTCNGTDRRIRSKFPAPGGVTDLFLQLRQSDPHEVEPMTFAPQTSE